jgi:hypothetical protein
VAALLLWRAEAPLPEGNAYVRGLVEKQRHREELLDRYTYDLVSVREELDDRGRVKDSETRRYEIYFVKGRPVRRLVEEDGRPLSKERQEREDREARALAEAVRSGRAVSERPGGRLSAILDRYDFRAVAREEIAGRTAIVLAFRPRAGDLALEGDRYLRRLAGRIWVDEAEQEIVRTEIENLAPLKVGFGLGASVSSLSMRIDFRKVDDAVWLPAEDETMVSGRMLLFRKFQRRFRRTYSRYRRFSVDSEETPSVLPSPSPPSSSPSPSPSRPFSPSVVPF